MDDKEAMELRLRLAKAQGMDVGERVEGHEWQEDRAPIGRQSIGFCARCKNWVNKSDPCTGVRLPDPLTNAADSEALLWFMVEQMQFRAIVEWYPDYCRARFIKGNQLYRAQDDSGKVAIALAAYAALKGKGDKDDANG